MKAKFTAADDRHVSLEYECAATGARLTRMFFCFSGRSSVREEVGPHGKNRLVCDRLGSYGEMLTMNGNEPLVAVIRREYQAMRRAERAERASDAGGRVRPGQAVTGSVHQG